MYLALGIFCAVLGSSIQFPAAPDVRGIYRSGVTHDSSIFNGPSIPDWVRPSALLQTLTGALRLENSCFHHDGFSGHCEIDQSCTAKGGVVKRGQLCGKLNRKVCCSPIPLAKLRTCGHVIEESGIHFVNPVGEPAVEKEALSGGRCSVLVKVPHSICQLRIELLSFNVSQPSLDLEGKPRCVDDIFSVHAGVRSVAYPDLCGDNDGQHHVRESPQVLLTMKLAAYLKSLPRYWNIQIKFISCDSKGVAPPGCLQFHSSSRGTIRSFNYGVKSSMIDGLKYRVCLNPPIESCAAHIDQKSHHIKGPLSLDVDSQEGTLVSIAELNTTAETQSLGPSKSVSSTGPVIVVEQYRSGLFGWLFGGVVRRFRWKRPSHVPSQPNPTGEAEEPLKERESVFSEDNQDDADTTPGSGWWDALENYDDPYLKWQNAVSEDNPDDEATTSGSGFEPDELDLDSIDDAEVSLPPDELLLAVSGANEGVSLMNDGSSNNGSLAVFQVKVPLTELNFYLTHVVNHTKHHSSGSLTGYPLKTLHNNRAKHHDHLKQQKPPHHGVHKNNTKHRQQHEWPHCQGEKREKHNKSHNNQTKFHQSHHNSTNPHCANDSTITTTKRPNRSPPTILLPSLTELELPSLMIDFPSQTKDKSNGTNSTTNCEGRFEVRHNITQLCANSKKPFHCYYHKIHKYRHELLKNATGCSTNKTEYHLLSHDLHRFLYQLHKLHHPNRNTGLPGDSHHKNDHPHNRDKTNLSSQVHNSHPHHSHPHNNHSHHHHHHHHNHHNKHWISNDRGHPLSSGPQKEQPTVEVSTTSNNMNIVNDGPSLPSNDVVFNATTSTMPNGTMGNSLGTNSNGDSHSRNKSKHLSDKWNHPESENLSFKLAVKKNKARPFSVKLGLKNETPQPSKKLTFPGRFQIEYMFTEC